MRTGRKPAIIGRITEGVCTIYTYNKYTKKVEIGSTYASIGSLTRQGFRAIACRLDECIHPIPKEDIEEIRKALKANQVTYDLNEAIEIRTKTNLEVEGFTYHDENPHDKVDFRTSIELAQYEYGYPDIPLHFEVLGHKTFGELHKTTKKEWKEAYHNWREFEWQASQEPYGPEDYEGDEHYDTRHKERG